MQVGDCALERERVGPTRWHVSVCERGFHRVRITSCQLEAVHSLDAYFGVIYLSPGAVLPDHTHSDEEELERNIDGSDVSGWVPRTAVLRLDGIQGGVAL